MVRETLVFVSCSSEEFLLQRRLLCFHLRHLLPRFFKPEMMRPAKIRKPPFVVGLLPRYT